MTGQGKLAELLRFCAVAVAGLVVDIAVAWSLAELLGLPLILAASVGFLCGAVVNYLAHEFWTFQDGARALSLARIARYGGGLVVVFIARLAAVAGLEWLLGRNGTTLTILFAATILSFAVNYLVSRHFIFTPAARDSSESDRP